MEYEKKSPDSEEKRILMAEGDPALIQLMGSSIKGGALLIDQIGGDQYLEAVQRQSYDLILTDPRQKGSVGVQLLREIRQAQPGAKVILLICDGTPSDIICAMRERVFSLFNCPFDRANLIGMIASALETSDWENDIEVISARPGWTDLRIKPRIVTADRVYHFMKELASDLSDSVREKITTAFREVLLNACEYGAGFGSDHPVEVYCIRGKRALIYRIQDPGRGFSFREIPHAAISNPPDQPSAHMQYRMEKGLRDGGFGILIAHELADELLFNEAGNEVVILKYLD
jgi:anti-sigma regulatory factor (Ser/Thr protein kinase)/CheY-like chemotaxis protein